MPSFEIELKYNGLVAGLDEAGRGPFAGPVVAAAVILDRNNTPEKINDSKKLSPQAREKLHDKILASARVGIGIVSVEQIDRLNIGRASLIAMERAFHRLGGADAALIDGNLLPRLPCLMEAVVKGDSKSLSIAAASIIAKVTRDRIMDSLAREFPHYGWEENKGYGTAQHMAALTLHGPTPHHRRSFAPVREALNTLEIAE